MNDKNPSELFSRNNWNLITNDDQIAEWKIQSPNHPDYTSFILSIQRLNQGYNVSISVMFSESNLADLLRSDFDKICESADIAEKQADLFATRVEETKLKT